MSITNHIKTEGILFLIVRNTLGNIIILLYNTGSPLDFTANPPNIDFKKEVHACLMIPGPS